MTLWRLGVVAASKSAAAVPAGYAAGGGNPALSTVDKLTFATDTYSTGTNIVTAANAITGASSSTAGYVFGGNNPAISTIGKYVFASDVTSNLANGLGTAVQVAGAFHSTTNAYVCGGFTTANVSSVQKMSFASETNSLLPTGLSETKRNGAGAQSSTFGYFAGGYGSGPTPRLTSVNKFLFSNDSRSTLPVGITTVTNSLGRDSMAGWESSTAAYFAGGRAGAPPAAIVTTVDKFTFADDSKSSATGLSVGRANGAPFQSTTAGYFAGGYDTSFVNFSTTVKYAFASETDSTLGATITARNSLAGFEVL